MNREETSSKAISYSHSEWAITCMYKYGLSGKKPRVFRSYIPSLMSHKESASQCLIRTHDLHHLPNSILATFSQPLLPTCHPIHQRILTPPKVAEEYPCYLAGKAASWSSSLSLPRTPPPLSHCPPLQIPLKWEKQNWGGFVYSNWT